jgi:NarL family two-component system response regulator YdfI
VNPDVVRVAIAAFSDVACAQIETLVAAEKDLCVVGSAASTALADLLRRADPDVLLVDIGSETAEALEHIAEQIALPATVLLSSNPHSVQQLLGLGVRAVLPSRTSAARLVAAVKAVAAGLIVVDERTTGVGALGEYEERRERETVDALTPREVEVLQLLAEGLPNKEIAKALVISEHTVKFHLAAIFGKLGATSRTEAVAIGIRRGLVMV